MPKKATQFKKPTLKQLPVETVQDPNLPVAHGTDTDNAELLTHVMQTFEIAKSVNTDDIDSLQNALLAYLQLCSQTNRRITNQGVYNALGVTRQTISLWATGQRHGNDPRYRKFAETIKGICAQYREDMLVSGMINPVVGIWHQKNYDGFRDYVPEEREASGVLAPATDPSEIAERYRHLLDTGSEERLEEERRKRDLKNELPTEDGDIND